jgi:predicted transcriptional regulator
VVSIPEREMIVWHNPELAAEIREGLAEAERGETVDLGTFQQHDDEADEDED